MEIGESLVGAYLRHVRGCHTIAYNAYLPDQQGEIDVIGIGGAGVEQSVWIAEVAIHLDDLNYGSYPLTIAKIRQKADRARRYARDVHHTDAPNVEFWAPRVPPGIVKELEQFPGITYVFNREFTRRVHELAAIASRSTKLYGEEAFRLLQLLTHLVGDKPQFVSPPQAPAP
ncbi:hypothetical protein M1843_19600 [Isoptericola sp. 4D.3]|uniref:Uncharacterized protein n=1 Tax=Isoptericola peretonis TaxID=2918523 RepID=A0ABT0J8X8_9MICO|nr:hypothetical protein [Isoptericola sp. 4D.3]